jgi:ABC-2 type transport system ATP-binding protein
MKNSPINVVETRDLTKSVGDLLAVDGLTLTIRQGEMFGLVGPDGAGKTTTIRMLCGVLLPSSGGARILERDLAGEADRIKEEIGYLSQRFSLYGDLSVDENIEFFAEIHGVYDYKSRREELLEFTRLAPFRKRLAERLSGGMKQKLALSCTLIHRPRIIFLDEPTTGVDPVSRRDFWRILQSLLREGITVVMSTPYLDEAERCTTVTLLNKGAVMKTDTPERLKKYMKGEIVEVVCDQVRQASAALAGHPGVLEVQTFGDRLNSVLENASRDLTDVEPALAGQGVTVRGTRVMPPSLENVFISLLTHPEHEGVRV